jgi:hypothetical protein
MAKFLVESSQASAKKNPEQETLDLVSESFKTMRYSPKPRIAEIFRYSHVHFKELVRALVHQLISQQDHSVLDRVIMYNRIQPRDGWVPNVARLSEKCISEQIADELLRVTTVLTSEELRLEVRGKLQELLKLREERMQGYRAYEAAVVQARATGRATNPIPPAIPLPSGIKPPTDAFPLLRLQPFRGKPETDAVWIS